MNDELKPPPPQVHLRRDVDGNLEETYIGDPLGFAYTRLEQPEAHASFDEWWSGAHGEAHSTTKREYDMCSCAYTAGEQSDGLEALDKGAVLVLPDGTIIAGSETPVDVIEAAAKALLEKINER